MYESKFCHMCRYIKVPHESLTWFMVWTCWSILIYNQQMCFISWSTNFVIAKRMTQWPLQIKLHIITQYLMFVQTKGFAVLHNTALLSELIKRCRHPAKIFFIHWKRGRLVTYCTSIFIIKMMFVRICHS